MTEVELTYDDLAATLRGGPYLTITSLRKAAHELLAAPTALPDAYTVHGQRAGITLLHPWANRLGAHEFKVGRRHVSIPRADPLAAHDPAGLPIHGLAHPQGWTFQRLTARRARASATWPHRTEFPFPHAVEVEVELRAPGRLIVTTSVAATEDVSVPVAFGWHPYFRSPRQATVRLGLPRHERLELDPAGLPTGRHRTEEATSVALDGQALDDGFSGVAEGATFSLHTSDATIAVSHDCGFACAQVFAPTDADVVSLEPMTAPTDALRSGRGLCWARPGEPYTARFSIAVDDLPR